MFSLLLFFELKRIKYGLDIKPMTLNIISADNVLGLPCLYIYYVPIMYGYVLIVYLLYVLIMH